MRGRGLSSTGFFFVVEGPDLYFLVGVFFFVLLEFLLLIRQLRVSRSTPIRRSWIDFVAWTVYFLIKSPK